MVLAHYALQPDRVWELPRAAVRAVELDEGRVRLLVSGVGSLSFTGWTGRAALDSPLRDADDLADVLRRWLAGDADPPPTPPTPHRHRAAD